MLDTIPNVLIVTEGLTEYNYLRHLKERNAGYSVHIYQSVRTDPEKILGMCKEKMKDRSIHPKYGDLAYCVMDVDFNDEAILRKVLDSAKKSGVRILLSNPCFEVFLLYHYLEKLPPFDCPKDVKDYMQSFIPNYRESGDYWETLRPMKDDMRRRLDGVKLEDVPLKLIRGTSVTNVSSIFGDLEVLRRRQSKHL